MQRRGYLRVRHAFHDGQMHYCPLSWSQASENPFYIDLPAGILLGRFFPAHQGLQWQQDPPAPRSSYTSSCGNPHKPYGQCLGNLQAGQLTPSCNQRILYTIFRLQIPNDRTGQSHQPGPMYLYQLGESIDFTRLGAKYQSAIIRVHRIKSIAAETNVYIRRRLSLR